MVCLKTVTMVGSRLTIPASTLTHSPTRRTDAVVAGGVLVEAVLGYGMFQALALMRLGERFNPLRSRIGASPLDQVRVRTRQRPLLNFA
jgi:hypothetical protein